MFQSVNPTAGMYTGTRPKTKGMRSLGIYPDHLNAPYLRHKANNG